MLSPAKLTLRAGQRLSTEERLGSASHKFLPRKSNSQEVERQKLLEDLGIFPAKALRRKVFKKPFPELVLRTFMGSSTRKYHRRGAEGATKGDARPFGNPFDGARSTQRGILDLIQLENFDKPNSSATVDSAHVGGIGAWA